MCDITTCENKNDVGHRFKLGHICEGCLERGSESGRLSIVYLGNNLTKSNFRKMENGTDRHNKLANCIGVYTTTAYTMINERKCQSRFAVLDLGA